MMQMDRISLITTAYSISTAMLENGTQQTTAMCASCAADGECLSARAGSIGRRFYCECVSIHEIEQSKCMSRFPVRVLLVIRYTVGQCCLCHRRLMADDDAICISKLKQLSVAEQRNVHTN